MNYNFKQERETMLREHLGRRGITDRAVLQAMYRTPRELFLDDTLKQYAYDDKALPIGSSQTISQPYIVALMTMFLHIQAGDKILEVGTGCGYQTAVLAHFNCSIFTIERVEALYKKAIYNLQQLPYCSNVTHLLGDGTNGHADEAPYNKIIVTAAAPGLVKPLLKQLAVGGKLIIPEGSMERQILKVYSRKGNSYTVKEISYCKFVPLIGQNGWDG